MAHVLGAGLDFVAIALLLAAVIEAALELVAMAALSGPQLRAPGGVTAGGTAIALAVIAAAADPEQRRASTAKPLTEDGLDRIGHGRGTSGLDNGATSMAVWDHLPQMVTLDGSPGAAPVSTARSSSRFAFRGYRI